MKCINELFKEQAERASDSIAVVFEGRKLTYRELNRRADELAGQLRVLGVGPDGLVALFLERSPEMVFVGGVEGRRRIFAARPGSSAQKACLHGCGCAASGCDHATATAVRIASA